MPHQGPCVRAKPGVAAVAALLCWSCGGSSTPSPPNGGSPSGTVPVRGTERLYWDQVGAVGDLTFRAYVDGQPVALSAATCDAAQAGPQGVPCVSPLPPLTVGVHTIALTAVSRASGLESAPSAPVTVQKLAGLTASGAAMSAPASSPDAAPPAVGRVLPDTVATTDGGIFDVEVVARGLDAPTQLALAPDGRLFVAERTGRVLVLDSLDGAAPSPRDGTRGAPGPAEGSEPEVALDPTLLFDRTPSGPIGLALHPDFAGNRFVYLAYATHSGADGAAPSTADGAAPSTADGAAPSTPDGAAPTLLVVRLREAGGTLGEPMVVFGRRLAGLPADGPRVAFGPDRHLYVVVAAGVADGGATEEAAGGTLLRLDDRGGVEGLSGAAFAWGTRRALAVAWHPTTQQPWALLEGPGGAATLGPIGPGQGYGAGVGREAPALDAGYGGAAGAFVFEPASGRGSPPTALVGLPGNDALLRLRPEIRPERILGAGRIGDIVRARDGTLLVATRNRDGLGAQVAGDDLVIRLAPRGR